MQKRSGRAAPLSPDERRRAIVDAVIPLLVRRGAEVTTKQIAAAAGVAEGTIFRVFRDKHELLHAAAERTMDPSGLANWLAGIDEDADLAAKVHAAVTMMLTGAERVIGVMIAVRGLSGPAPRPETGDDSGPDQRRDSRPGGGGPPDFVLNANRALLDTLTELLRPHAGELRFSPERTALMLRGLVLGTVHPGLAEGDKPTAEEITAALLSGVTKGEH